jgi:hypothetical protein
MTLLPYAVGDDVDWKGCPGTVIEAGDERVVVAYWTETGRRMVAITSPRALRAQQSGVVQRDAEPPWPTEDAG